MNNNKVCFIIAHKYYRGYESYLKYYIENIQKFYPEALTIIVDNNSKYPEDIFGPLRNLSNIVFLTNDIECKFELGAYQVGIKYILENNITYDYSYFVFTQDNFVIKNFYDFNRLIEKQTYALPINSMNFDGHARDVFEPILNKLGMNNHLDKVSFCWCSSFIVSNHKISMLLTWFEQIIQKVRWDSEGAERYLARFLWEMNEQRNCGDIDGDCRNLPGQHYDCWKVNIYDPATTYFVKKVQQKNQDTRDKE